jgi:signal transduction histidine kinase
MLIKVLSLNKTIEARIRPVSNSANNDQKIEKIVQISLQKLIFNDEECSIIMIRDITALKRLTKVENKNKATSLMTASVSHELLTPLKCISSFGKELMTLITSTKVRYKAELIVSTTNLVISQIKFLLDKNLLDQNVFAP